MRRDRGLAVVARRASGLLILEVSGPIDDSTVGELRRAFGDLYSAASTLVVMDMRQVPLIDSEGLGALISIQKRLVELGRRLVLLHCQEAVRTALTLTRLGVLLPQYPSLDSIPKEW